MNLENYKQIIEMFDDLYRESCDSFASLIFKEKIKPVLDQFQLRLVAGNNDYAVYPTHRTPNGIVRKYADPHDTNQTFDLEKDIWIKEALHDYLSLQPHFMRNPLGTIMPCYDPTEEAVWSNQLNTTRKSPTDCK
jgi:hypothetical protein